MQWFRHLVLVVAIMCILFLKEVYLCLALEMRKGKERCHARSAACQRGTERTARTIQLHYFLLRQIQSREFRRLVSCFIYTEGKGLWMLLCEVHLSDRETNTFHTGRVWESQALCPSDLASTAALGDHLGAALNLIWGEIQGKGLGKDCNCSNH